MQILFEIWITIDVSYFFKKIVGYSIKMLCISLTEVLFLWIPFNAAYHSPTPTSVLCRNS